MHLTQVLLFISLLICSVAANGKLDSIDSCTSMPCLNNGICKALYNQTFNCICEASYFGTVCQCKSHIFYCKISFFKLFYYFKIQKTKHQVYL